MTNPLVVVRALTVGVDGPEVGRSLWLWCPGCELAHWPLAPLPDGSRPDPTMPYWEWNGRTDSGFTISPSLLVHSSVHLCAGEDGPDYVCPDPDGCGAVGHLILDEDEATGRRVLGHRPPHRRQPSHGPCHSFIRDGRWQFLPDSGHALAGRTVPMVPVPDWLLS